MDHMSFIPFSRVKGAINLHTCNPIPVCKSTCKHDHTRNTTIHRYMPCCLIQVVTGNWKPVLDRFERIYRMAFQQLRAENHRSDQMITSNLTFFSFLHNVCYIWYVTLTF